MPALTRNLWIGPIACSILGFAALIYLMRQAPMGSEHRLVAPAGGYRVTAKFDNVGDLRVGSPLTIAGVKIGAVEGIRYESRAGQAVVTLRVVSPGIQLPRDSDATIHSQSLLGGKKVEIVAGGSAEFLADGGEILSTQSTVALETLVKKGLDAFKNRKVSATAAAPAPP